MTEQITNKVEEKKEDKKVTPKETKKVEEKKIVKDVAIVNAFSLPVSPKDSYAICDAIRGKTPDYAIAFLEKVLLMKKAVPMNNREVPHRKGNIMAGRYPLNTSREFISLLKQLKANASINNIENAVISLAMANRASRPYKRGGKRAKRTNIRIEVKNKQKAGKK